MPPSIMYFQKDVKGCEKMQMQQDSWSRSCQGEEQCNATHICATIKLKKKLEIQRQQNLGDSEDDQHYVHGILQEILE